jgi:WD40 repeat protein
LSNPLPGIELFKFVAFSPDGSTLAVGGKDVLQLYDITDPARPRPLGNMPLGDLATGAFSADGRMLATGNAAEHDVDLWDTSDPAHPTHVGLSLPGHTEAVSEIAFAPDGHSLATADSAGTILFWDLTDQTQPKMLGSPIEIGDGMSVVTSMDFADDSTAIAVGSSNGSVTIVDLSGMVDLREHAVERACDRVGRGLDPDEWARYVPNLPYEQTCPD